MTKRAPAPRPNPGRRPGLGRGAEARGCSIQGLTPPARHPEQTLTLLVAAAGSRLVPGFVDFCLPSIAPHDRIGPTNHERDRQPERIWQDRTASLSVMLGRTRAIRRFTRASCPARTGQRQMDCRRSWVSLRVLEPGGIPVLGASCAGDRGAPDRHVRRQAGPEGVWGAAGNHNIDRPPSLHSPGGSDRLPAGTATWF